MSTIYKQEKLKKMQYGKTKYTTTSYMDYLKELDEKGKLTPLQKRQIEKFKNLKKSLAVEPKMESNSTYRRFIIKNVQKEIVKSPHKGKGKEVPCNFCSKLKYVPPYLLKEYKWHFCNKVCQDNYYRAHPRKFK